MKTFRRFSLCAALLIGLATVTSGCGSGSGHASHPVKMAPLSEMPERVQHAAVSVQDAYRFAVANPEVESAIPCYCGCGGMGHRSNYACFVSRVDAGEVTFDGHALGCSICVDIALDARRLMGEGKSVQEIRTYVDATYAKYGQSNM